MLSMRIKINYHLITLTTIGRAILDTQCQLHTVPVHNNIGLTEDLSTFDAEFAHLTSASKRMNNCRVRAEKL